MTPFLHQLTGATFLSTANCDDERLTRFERKTMPEPNSGCLLWLGGTNEHGYGVFWNGSRLEKAHRFAYRVFRNPGLSNTIDLLHRCDNPACVNAWHCFEGDALANVADMWSKRRATVITYRGTAQTQAKLTDQKASEIRLAYDLGRANQYELAAQYGVSQRTIWNVIHDRNWAKPSGTLVERGRGR